MAHLQNWFRLLPSDTETTLPWSENLDKLLVPIIAETASKHAVGMGVYLLSM